MAFVGNPSVNKLVFPQNYCTIDVSAYAMIPSSAALTSEKKVSVDTFSFSLEMFAAGNLVLKCFRSGSLGSILAN